MDLGGRGRKQRRLRRSQLAPSLATLPGASLSFSFQDLFSFENHNNQTAPAIKLDPVLFDEVKICQLDSMDIQHFHGFLILLLSSLTSARQSNDWYHNSYNNNIKKLFLWDPYYQKSSSSSSCAVAEKENLNIGSDDNDNHDGDHHHDNDDDHRQRHHRQESNACIVQVGELLCRIYSRTDFVSSFVSSSTTATSTSTTLCTSDAFCVVLRLALALVQEEEEDEEQQHHHQQQQQPNATTATAATLDEAKECCFSLLEHIGLLAAKDMVVYTTTMTTTENEIELVRNWCLAMVVLSTTNSAALSTRTNVFKKILECLASAGGSRDGDCARNSSSSRSQAQHYARAALAALERIEKNRHHQILLLELPGVNLDDDEFKVDSKKTVFYLQCLLLVSLHFNTRIQTTHHDKPLLLLHWGTPLVEQLLHAMVATTATPPPIWGNDSERNNNNDKDNPDHARRNMKKEEAAACLCLLAYHRGGVHSSDQHEDKAPDDDNEDDDDDHRLTSLYEALRRTLEDTDCLTIKRMVVIGLDKLEPVMTISSNKKNCRGHNCDERAALKSLLQVILTPVSPTTVESLVTQDRAPVVATRVLLCRMECLLWRRRQEQQWQLQQHADADDEAAATTTAKSGSMQLGDLSKICIVLMDSTDDHVVSLTLSFLCRQLQCEARARDILEERPDLLSNLATVLKRSPQCSNNSLGLLMARQVVNAWHALSCGSFCSSKTHDEEGRRRSFQSHVRALMVRQAPVLDALVDQCNTTARDNVQHSEPTRLQAIQILIQSSQDPLNHRILARHPGLLAALIYHVRYESSSSADSNRNNNMDRREFLKQRIFDLASVL